MREWRLQNKWGTSRGRPVNNTSPRRIGKGEEGVHALVVMTASLFGVSRRGFACSGEIRLWWGDFPLPCYFFSTRVDKTIRAALAIGFNDTCNGLGQDEVSPAGSACFDATRTKELRLTISVFDPLYACTSTIRPSPPWAVPLNPCPPIQTSSPHNEH